MLHRVLNRSRDRRRRWALTIAYMTLLASCESPLAPDVTEVERLEVTPPVLTMSEGGEATLIARVYGPDDALLPAANVFWSTQDRAVVTVNQNGLVTAVAAGTAQVAASSGGQSRTIAVTVSPRPIALVRITPPAGNVAVGQTLTLQGEALDGTGAIIANRSLEWTSSEPTIATVDNAGVVTGVTVGQTTISATGEGKVGTSIVSVLPSAVASITIQPNGGTIPAGATLALTATPRDAGGQPLAGGPLSWRSSNDAVATVSSAGLVTAISPGAVTITAFATGAGPNGSTPSATVNVTVLVAPVASAVIVPNPTSVLVGRTVALTLNLFNAGGAPLSTAGRNIVWSTSNAAVATVNASSGVVTGVAVGFATVTVTVTTPGQPSVVTATAQVNVSNQPVTSVVVTPSSGTVHVGYGRPFVAVALDATGQPLPGRAILWTSSNQTVATVDASTGVVTGVSQGSVQIRATSEGIQGVANVLIDLVPVSSVVVTPPTATLTPPQTIQLAAEPRDSAGTPIQGTALGGRPTTWASATPSTATVSLTGLVTAVAQGSSVVTATIGGTPGQSSITVGAPPSAGQLAIITQPSATTPNDAAFPQQPVIQLKDALGNNVSTPGVTIQAAITAPGTGTLGGTTSAITNAAGTATFSGLKITGLIGVRTLTFSSSALTVTSNGVNVQAGAPTQLALTTPPPSSANSGQVFSSPSVVQLRDISGNDVPQAGITVNATVQPGGATLGGSSVSTSASGAATFGALSLTGPAGSYSLTFSSGALSPVPSGSITLSAGSGQKLSITAQPPSSVPNGQPFGAVVQLLDASNNPVAQAGVNVSAAIVSGNPALGGTTVATTNAAGVATFSNLIITGLTGSRTLLFGAASFTTVESTPINVTPGAAAALAITSQPSSPAQSGVPFGNQPSVQLRDISGNDVAQGGVSITVSLIGAGGSLIGSGPATTSGSGAASFSGLGISGLAGTYSLSFAAGGSITGATSANITLLAGPAAQLTITTQPGGATSGSAFTTQPVVKVTDAQTSPVAGVTVTAASATGTLLGSVTAISDAAGNATFAGLGLSGTVGSYTLQFSAPSVASVPSNSFTLAPGAPALLTIQTQPAGALNGSAFGTQPAILVQDAQSNPVAAGVTVSVVLNEPGATLTGSASAQTNASGVAAFSGLGLTGTVGSYTLTFSSGAAPGVSSGSIALGAGAASKLTMSAQPPSSALNGAVIAPPPSVQLRDASDNIVTQAGVNVDVGLVGPGGALSGTTTVPTDGSGVAAFSGLTITGTAGNYQLSFSSGGLTGTTSNAITLTASAATQLTITTSPPGTAVSGTPFASPPSVQLRDQFNNAVSQAGVTVDATLTGSGSLIGSASANTDANGLATFSGLGINATAAGSFTIGFSSSGLTGISSGTIQVTLPATQLSVTTEPSGNASSGAAFSIQPSVQLLDAIGNPVNQAGIPVTAAVTGGGASLVGTSTATTNGSGIATFTGLGIAGTVGSYSLTFSATGLTSAVSGSIALSHGAAAQLVIITQPGNGTSGSPLSPQPTIQLRDAQGNNVPTAGVTVTAAIQSGPGNTTLQGGSATTDASGLASFTSLALTHQGTNIYTLRFSATGVTGATSAQITISP